MTLKRYILLAAFTLPAFASFAQDYNNIEFVENKGQWDNRVKFKGNVSAGAFFIRSTGFSVLQHNPEELQAAYETMHGHKDQASKGSILHSHSYWVDFVGATTDMEIIPDKPLSSYNNYFIGNDPTQWAGGCKIYQAVTVKNVYDKVDVRYYTNNGTLKYDIIAHPGADISRIALQYRGVDKMQVKTKELKISTSLGDFKETLPYSYQSDGNKRAELSCKYILKDNVVRFDVQNYDPTATLIIDPVLIFCTFTGSPANNWGFTATYGPDGSAYGGGILFDDGFYTPGAFQTGFQGGNNSGVSNAPIDIGVIKFSPNGASRIYATYLGGNGNEQPHSLVVDGQGNLIVAGRSNSTNYPGGLIGLGGDWDITVTKFNSTGTAIIGSQRIGGRGMDGANITSGSNGVASLQQNYGDDGRSEVILDPAGNIYIASCAQSTDFPTNNGFQTSFGGGLQDGVLIKLNANASALLFSSYLGGGGNDAAYVLSLSPVNGDIYVAGGTESTNFPGDHTSTIYSANQGGIDGFVARIANNGSAIIKSTYLGTGGTDQVFGVQFDKNGFPYVMGQTTGAWRIVNATYVNTGSKQFIAKLEPDLSNWVYSTVFGTGSSIPNISPVAFLVDRCENVYVSGWGGLIVPASPSYYPSAGTGGMPTTPDAIKTNSPDNSDFYFFVLKKNATNILYGSFFGQDGGLVDHVDGGTSRFDQTGVIYQAICANCGGGPPFPVTPGAWATSKPASAYCNLAVVKIAFNLAGVLGNVKSAINGVPRDSAGCVPLTVDFIDTVGIAANYEWNFGDGSPVLSTTTPNASHTYNVIGNYLVMLIAIDPTTCNIRDTSYVHIRVGDQVANLNFSITKLPPCDSFKYRFDNLSTAIRPYGPQSFRWDFGDGSPRITAGTASVFHNYPGPGTYNVRLVIEDTNYCNAPDSMTIQLRVAANVKARFTTPPTGCTPYDAIFTNTSLAGSSFEWDFGDGSTSTAISPTHLYSTAGTYTITLVANDPNTCNLTDTTRFTISVYDNPVADYFFTPDPPVVNTPTTFTNLSSLDAILFKWDFGDGDTLNTISRLPIQHQYNATGTFNACLTVFNAAGCPDSVCKQVKALIDPLVDVPNAFTPQSGDINSKILVRGFGIAKMQFVIWNRWGQKVFETGNRFQGWDGKVKGVLQPMDVYAYTLSVEFFDGTKTTRRGDITLIR